MGIFLRFILPSLFRRCLDHRIGPHSPRLHFCREPNLASDRREPLCSCRVNIVPLGNHSAHTNRCTDANITLLAGGPSLPAPIFTHQETHTGIGTILVEALPTDLGTKRWNRTTDIRDMSPLFCRLNYLGICNKRLMCRQQPYYHIAVGRILVDGFLLHLSKPSALLISEGNIKKERKGSRLPAAHPQSRLIYTRQFWSFALPLASATLVLTSSFRSQTDGGICPLDIYQLFGGIISFILHIYYIIYLTILQIIIDYDF